LRFAELNLSIQAALLFWNSFASFLRNISFLHMLY
jgi:hypothetical protein